MTHKIAKIWNRVSYETMIFIAFLIRFLSTRALDLDTWSSAWDAMDYSMGNGSRLLIGRGENKMTEGQVLDVAKEAIYTIIICSAPMLIISLVVGLIVSIFQTVTSIQEQTLTFVPKIIAVFVGLMIFGSWILTNLTEFVTTLWSNFSMYLG